MALTVRILLAAVVLTTCLSGCKEKSVFQRNAVSEKTLTQIDDIRRTAEPPALPVPEPPPGVNRTVVLETPADRFMPVMTGLPDGMVPPPPDGIPQPPVPGDRPQPFVRLFEPPQGLDASPMMRELEVIKDLKLVKEREMPWLAEMPKE